MLFLKKITFLLPSFIFCACVRPWVGVCVLEKVFWHKKKKEEKEKEKKSFQPRLSHAVCFQEDVD